MPFTMAPESDLGCQETDSTDSLAPRALLVPAFPLSGSLTLESPALHGSRAVNPGAVTPISCSGLCAAQSVSPWGLTTSISMRGPSRLSG